MKPSLKPRRFPVDMLRRARVCLCIAAALSAQACASSWAPMPRADQHQPPTPATVLPARAYSADELTHIEEGGGVVFTAAKAGGNAVDVSAGNAKLTMMRGHDGRWHAGGEADPTADLVALQGGETVVVDGSTVCHAKCGPEGLALHRCGFAAGSATPNAGMACYDLGSYLGPAVKDIAVHWDHGAVEVFWVPLDEHRHFNRAGVGLILRSAFSAEHPEGVGQVAWLKFAQSGEGASHEVERGGGCH